MHTINNNLMHTINNNNNLGNFSGGQYRVPKYRGTVPWYFFLVPIPVPNTGTAVHFFKVPRYIFLKYRGIPSNSRVIESFFASIATCFCFSYRLQLKRSFLIYSSIITNSHLSNLSVYQYFTHLSGTSFS